MLYVHYVHITLKFNCIYNRMCFILACDLQTKVMIQFVVFPFQKKENFS